MRKLILYLTFCLLLSCSCLAENEAKSKMSILAKLEDVYLNEGKLYAKVRVLNSNKDIPFMIYEFNVCSQNGTMFQNLFKVEKLDSSGKLRNVKSMGLTDFVGPDVREDEFVTIDPGGELVFQCDLTLEYGKYDGELAFRYLILNPAYIYGEVDQPSVKLESNVVTIKR